MIIVSTKDKTQGSESDPCKALGMFKHLSVASLVFRPDRSSSCFSYVPFTVECLPGMQLALGFISSAIHFGTVPPVYNPSA